ncbi:hypothetical protein V8E55_009658 [Tylopilus felleus]
MVFVPLAPTVAVSLWTAYTCADESGWSGSKERPIVYCTRKTSCVHRLYRHSVINVQRQEQLKLLLDQAQSGYYTFRRF